MNQADAERWKSEVLDEVFRGLAASPELDETLVFKGARVLNLRLGGGRQSLDLDSNLASDFVRRFPDREDQRAFLEREMTRTIRRHFERQEPVRFELARLQVRTYPPNSHPMGWDAFKAKINVNDLSRRVLGLPALDIDVAAPIPKDVPFAEAEATLVAVVEYFQSLAVIPFSFPLPQQ